MTDLVFQTFATMAMHAGLLARDSRLTDKSRVELLHEAIQHLPDDPGMAQAAATFVRESYADQPGAGRRLIDYIEAAADMRAVNSLEASGEVLEGVFEARGYEFPWQERVDING